MSATPPGITKLTQPRPGGHPVATSPETAGDPALSWALAASAALRSLG